jgi:hypothetical protein
MIDLTSLPTLQGRKSTTFTRPPLDGSLTLPELYAFHALNSSQHPLFTYVDDGSAKRTREICYPEAYTAIQRAHGIVSRYHSDLLGDVTTAPVVGILASLGRLYFENIIQKQLNHCIRYCHLHHFYSRYHACRTDTLSDLYAQFRCRCRSLDTNYWSTPPFRKPRFGYAAYCLRSYRDLGKRSNLRQDLIGATI